MKKNEKVDQLSFYLTGFLSCTQRRPSIVERPMFDVSSTQMRENDKKAEKIATNKNNNEFIFNEMPQASQEKMFDAIHAKYNGKIVMVDFWETLCGPCMSAMKSILPLKEKMKGKDIVFLYLTNTISSLDAFERTYPTISGEHYRVSESQ